MVLGVFAVNMAMKIAFSLVVFFAFGTGTDEVMTNNLPSAMKLAVSGLVVANTFLSFPLPLIPVFRFLKRRGKTNGGRDHTPWFQAVQRTSVVVACGAFAFAVPQFALAMGLVGSVTLSFLSFIFPALFLLRLHGAKAPLALKAACVLVIGMGVFGAVAGLASNIALATGGQHAA